MKKIKFRGLKIDQSGWAYGYAVVNKYGASIVSEETRDDVIPESVGQFREDLDDGTEVYDDDIVEFKYEGQKRIEPVIGYNSITYVGRSHNFQLNKLFNDIETRPYSVLGNIHENPELLK